MPSVVGLLEQRGLVARRRVDELREEADRIQAELALAERDWKEWAIARARVGEVLDPVEETEQGHGQVGRTASASGGRAEQTSSAAGAAKPRSQVPVWREGLDRSVLSVDYQRPALVVRRSKSRTRRRVRIRWAKNRSTIHRLGSTTNPRMSSLGLTIARTRANAARQCSTRLPV